MNEKRYGSIFIYCLMAQFTSDFVISVQSNAVLRRTTQLFDDNEENL